MCCCHNEVFQNKCGRFWQKAHLGRHHVRNFTVVKVGQEEVLGCCLVFSGSQLSQSIGAVQPGLDRQVVGALCSYRIINFNYIEYSWAKHMCKI
jgi:hypothetical protein